MISGHFRSGQNVGLIQPGSPLEEHRMFFDRSLGQLRLSIVNPLTGMRLGSMKGQFYWTRKNVYLWPQSSKLIPGHNITVTFDDDTTLHTFQLVPAVTTTTSNLVETLHALEHGRTLHTGHDQEVPGLEPREGMFKLSDMLTVCTIFFGLLGLAALAYFICLLFGL